MFISEGNNEMELKSILAVAQNFSHCLYLHAVSLLCPGYLEGVQNQKFLHIVFKTEKIERIFDSFPQTVRLCS